MEDADKNLMEFGKHGKYSLIILMGMKKKKDGKGNADKTFALIPMNEQPDQQTQNVMNVLLNELKDGIKLIPDVRTLHHSWTFYEQSVSKSRKVIISIMEKLLEFHVM